MITYWYSKKLPNKIIQLPNGMEHSKFISDNFEIFFPKEDKSKVSDFRDFALKHEFARITKYPNKIIVHYNDNFKDKRDLWKIILEQIGPDCNLFVASDTPDFKNELTTTRDEVEDKLITMSRRIQSMRTPKNVYLNEDTQKLIQRLEKRVGHELKLKFEEGNTPYVEIEKLPKGGYSFITEKYLNNLAEHFLYDGYKEKQDSFIVYLDPAIMYTRPGIKSAFEQADSSEYNPDCARGRPGMIYYAGWYIDQDTPWIVEKDEISGVTVLAAFATQEEANNYYNTLYQPNPEPGQILPDYSYSIINILDVDNFDDLYVESLVSSVRRNDMIKSAWATDNTIRDEGWDAFNKGLSQSDNPYKFWRGQGEEQQYEDWNEGWEAAYYESTYLKSSKQIKSSRQIKSNDEGYFRPGRFDVGHITAKQNEFNWAYNSSFESEDSCIPERREKFYESIRWYDDNKDKPWMKEFCEEYNINPTTKGEKYTFRVALEQIGEINQWGQPLNSSNQIKSSIITPWDINQVTGTSDEDLGLSAVVDIYGNEFVNVDENILNELKDTLVRYFDDEAYVRDWNINNPDYQIEDAYDVIDPEEMKSEDLARYFDYEAYGRDIRLEDNIVWDSENQYWISVYDKNGKAINSSKKPIKSGFEYYNGFENDVSFWAERFEGNDETDLVEWVAGKIEDDGHPTESPEEFESLENWVHRELKNQGYFKTPWQVNSSKKPIISNKEPADMDMAYQLEGFIESDGELYRQMIVPAIKNLERKVKKGIYDYDKSLIMWQHVADEGAKRYVKELGGPAYNVATRKEVAKKLSEYYEENYMGDNPIESSKKNINSSWEEDVDFVVDQFMDEWMEKHPDSTTEECAAARKKYHDWVYERV